MKIIKCKCGQDILVDDENYETLKNVAWQCTGKWVYQSQWNKDHTENVSIASIIIMVETGKEPHHKDHNVHNNQKDNLISVTRSQNLAHRYFKENLVGYRYVYHSTGKKPYTAQVRKNGKNHYGGRFTTPEEAALAGDMLAKKLHGEYAVLNFPQSSSSLPSSSPESSSASSGGSSSSSQAQPSGI